jgi:hypothetical protein
VLSAVLKGARNLKVIGILASLLFVIVWGTLMGGLVLSVLWGWFVVPALHASAITIPQAIGLSLVVGMLTRGLVRDDKSEKNKDTSIGESLFTAFCIATIPPLFALGIGAIVHVFV